MRKAVEFVLEVRRQLGLPMLADESAWPEFRDAGWRGEVNTQLTRLSREHRFFFRGGVWFFEMKNSGVDRKSA